MSCMLDPSQVNITANLNSFTIFVLFVHWHHRRLRETLQKFCNNLTRKTNLWTQSCKNMSTSRVRRKSIRPRLGVVESPLLVRETRKSILTSGLTLVLLMKFRRLIWVVIVNSQSRLALWNMQNRLWYSSKATNHVVTGAEHCCWVLSCLEWCRAEAVQRCAGVCCMLYAVCCRPGLVWSWLTGWISVLSLSGESQGWTEPAAHYMRRWFMNLNKGLQPTWTDIT